MHQPRTNSLERGFFRLYEVEAKVPERKPKAMLRHPCPGVLREGATPLSSSEFTCQIQDSMPRSMARGMRMPMGMMCPGPARRNPVGSRGG